MWFLKKIFVKIKKDTSFLNNNFKFSSKIRVDNVKFLSLLEHVVKLSVTLSSGNN